MPIIKKQKQEKEKGSKTTKKDLLKALKKGNVELFDSLLEGVPKPYLLAEAIEKRKPAIVKLLIDRGVSFAEYLKRYGWSPLHYAVYRGDLEILKMLVSVNSELLFCGDCCPLNLATSENKLEIVEYLISLGFDVNQKNEHGEVPLASAKTPEAVELLIRRGADPDVGGLLDLCFRKERYELLEFYALLGVDAHKTFQDNASPFTKIIFEKRFELAKKFDPSACTKEESYLLWKVIQVTPDDDDDEDLLRETFKFLVENNIKPPNPVQITQFKDAFGESFKVDLTFLLCAREKNPESPFYKDCFPLDLLKVVADLTRKTLKKEAFEKLELGLN